MTGHLKTSRNSVTRFFASGFFHESSSPKPLNIALGSSNFFLRFAEIFPSQGAPPLSTSPAANFAAGTAAVVDTGGKFATGDNNTGVDTGGKLPPVTADTLK
jgi:hypothetical protein